MVWSPSIVRRRLFAYFYLLTLSATSYGMYMVPDTSSVVTGQVIAVLAVWVLVAWTGVVMDLDDLGAVLKTSAGGVGAVLAYTFLVGAAVVPADGGQAILSSTANHAAAVLLGVGLGWVLLAPAYLLRRRYDLDELASDETPEEKVMGHNLGLDADEDEQEP